MAARSRLSGPMSMSDTAIAVEELWRTAGGDPAALERLALSGRDPMLGTDIKIGTAASAVIAATGLAAAEMWRLRTGRTQTVSVDVRAAIAAFRSERFLRVNGEPPPDRRSALFGFYRTSDGRWVQLHTNMPITRTASCASSAPSGHARRSPSPSRSGRPGISRTRSPPPACRRRWCARATSG